jgi:hypothetical protein
MKKLFTLFVAAGVLAFVACGGSDKDKAKAKEDSTKKADSIAKVVEKAKKDSIAKADSIAKIEADTLKKKDEKKDNKKKEEKKK